MEFKKKTLIWEENNEPPKNYIWVREDGKAYEYVEHKGWIQSSLFEPEDSSKELTPDEIASYVASLYEEEPTDIVVSELPKIDSDNPPMEGLNNGGYVNSFYLLTWSGWTGSAISKTPPGTTADMTMRSSDDSWGWHFTFCPLCLLPSQDGLNWQFLIKVFQVTYTD